jgi:hypothetical protein
MRLFASLLVAALFAPALGFAQAGPDTAPPPPSSPPPLVPAGDEWAPPPSDVERQPGQGARLLPGTQPRVGDGFAQAPASNEPLPVEVGLMFSEGGFGMLTAAGVTIIPYYLFMKNLMLSSGDGIDPTAKTVIFMLLLATVPLSVSQTELSIANGSRFYVSDSWPASLSGLGAEALVFGLYALLGGINGGGLTEAVLILGSSVFVPLVEMAVINLTKAPRAQALAPNLGAALNYQPGRGLSVHLPIVAPLLSGRTVGLALPLVAGRF